LVWIWMESWPGSVIPGGIRSRESRNLSKN